MPVADGGVAALLMALQARDHETYLHERRVLALVLELGSAAALDDRELRHLSIAACLHDVGKMGIPDQILTKPGRLDTDELSVIRTHVEIGARIVGRLAIPERDEVARLVRLHHENVDGSGYPDGLKADRIPLAAQILRICDTLDAVISGRSYQQRRNLGQALQILDDESGRAFDPELVVLLSRLPSLEALADRRCNGATKPPDLSRAVFELTEGLFIWPFEEAPRIVPAQTSSTRPDQG